MNADKLFPQNFDEYIAAFPPQVQKILKKIRTTIKNTAPQAVETIKYHMPVFTLNGNLVYFAAFKNHIGFYPPVKGNASLGKELSVYEGPKGSLKFPLDEPIPYDLIKKIVRVRVNENMKKVALKYKKK